MRKPKSGRIWVFGAPVVALALALTVASTTRAQTPAAAPAAPAVSAPAPVNWAQRDREFETKVGKINAVTKARQMTIEELQAHLKKGDKIALLDVREVKENQVSALPGARLVLPDQVSTIPLDDIPADATVVTYCTAGYRSGMAAVALEGRLGRPVYTLAGGIIEWYNRGGKVVDPTGKPVNSVDGVEEPWISYVHPR